MTANEISIVYSPVSAAALSVCAFGEEEKDVISLRAESRVCMRQIGTTS